MPQLTLPATLESLESLFRFNASSVPAEYQSQKDNIDLVSEELLVNVFSYAYPNGGGKAEVTLGPVFLDNEEYLCFSVRDWGQPFNPFAEVRDPDLTLEVETRPIGGLGVYLIRKLTAHQFYCYCEGSNVIQVFFSRKPPEAS